jgi:nucleotide-binding universal stress UspA family protein
MLEFTDDDMVRREGDMTTAPTSQEKYGESAPEGQGAGPIIVVGVDGSAQSWDAFAWTAGEAQRRKGRIVAVFVTPLLQPGEALGGAPLGFAAAADAREEMAEELAVEVARRADTLGVAVRFVRGMGNTARVLTEVARAEQADLMVVGRSAKTLHRLAGSVSRRLVLKNDSPVTVVVP